MSFGEKAKLCYYGYRQFQVYIKIDDSYKDIAKDVETRFDALNYELDRALPQGKYKKSNWINERWISLKNHEKFCWIESKNGYLI